MGEVIHLERFRTGDPTDRAIREWAASLGVKLKPGARIADLPHALLLALAEGGAEGNDLLDALVLAAWREGKRDPRALPPFLRMRLVDLSLLLIDQFRFECMYRLGWIEPLAVRQAPLARLLSSRPRDLEPLRAVPSLKQDHFEYRRFQGLTDKDRETFLRRQIPAALEQFRRMTERC